MGLSEASACSGERMGAPACSRHIPTMSASRPERSGRGVMETLAWPPSDGSLNPATLTSPGGASVQPGGSFQAIRGRGGRAEGFGTFGSFEAPAVFGVVDVFGVATGAWAG